MTEILPANVSALHADMMATIRKAQSEGISSKDVFHAVARCFGTVMSELMPHDLALKFMKQEIGRMEKLANAQQGGTVQ